MNNELINVTKKNNLNNNEKKLQIKIIITHLKNVLKMYQLIILSEKTLTFSNIWYVKMENNKYIQYFVIIIL